ncbi:MAG: peptidylprolyl isomerase, partial [Clostridia bacterium]|nr:peptidylprolyl isomerase [Clostridia bacterium]
MANQTAFPAAGDTVAIINTTKGTIKVKLFPEETPKTFENFTTHAKNGYYDGIIFHR